MGSPWAGRLAATCLLLLLLAASNPPAAPAGEVKCAELEGLAPVDLFVQAAGASPWAVGTGYRALGSGLQASGLRGSDLLLVPARQVVAPFAPGPRGVRWDRSDRVASFLRGRDIISIHFPEGSAEARTAIVNGEAVRTRALLCQGRLYAPLDLLADGLGLAYRWEDDDSVVVMTER